MKEPAQQPTIASRSVRLFLVALVFVLMGSAVVVPQADAGEAPDVCSYASARVLGWLWADGSYNSTRDDFFVRTLSPAVAKHQTSLLDELGLDYRTGVSRRGHNNFRIVLPGYDASFLTDDFMDNPVISCRPDAVLASVIESEGSQQGRVFDDPKASRRDPLGRLLDDLDIGWTRSRQIIRANAVDWPQLQTLPFVSCGRVPGGAANCVLGQTG